MCIQLEMDLRGLVTILTFRIRDCAIGARVLYKKANVWLSDEAIWHSKLLRKKGLNQTVQFSYVYKGYNEWLTKHIKTIVSYVDKEQCGFDTNWRDVVKNAVYYEN